LIFSAQRDPQQSRKLASTHLVEPRVCMASGSKNARFASWKVLHFAVGEHGCEAGVYSGDEANLPGRMRLIVRCASGPMHGIRPSSGSAGIV
jgi:hypothetical protein